MPSRETRKEHNQERFRKANERLQAAIENGGLEPRRVPFLCECADDDCFGTVDLLVSDWEAIASQPRLYVMEAGHERSAGEEVVGTVGEYEVSRKPD